MPSEHAALRFLLDEHCPGWLADQLTSEGVDTVALTAHRPALRGADDTRVLRAAVAEQRVVVTEDVTTFGVAITAVPDHVGVVFCHHRRFPRTRAGLHRLEVSLARLAHDPPTGLGTHAVVWWLDAQP